MLFIYNMVVDGFYTEYKSNVTPKICCVHALDSCGFPLYRDYASLSSHLMYLTFSNQHD